ncbi:MAG: Ig domain-containing protein, partial [Candidatus Acidiferrum sp.]
MLRVRSGSVLLLFAAIAVVTSGCASTPPISVSLSPSSAQAIDQSQSLTIAATLTNDTSLQGISWSLTGPGSLSSSTGSSISYNTPTTSLVSAQQVTVTATSVANPAKSATLQITVNPYPQISLLATLPNGSVGTPYSEAIALTGGTPPFQWSIYDGPIVTGWMVSGAVPDGLTLNPSTGAISGTPTGAGTWYFEATVTDATGVHLVDGFLSLEIEPSSPNGNPVPFLNQPLAPTAVPPGSPAFTLSVSGAGFTPGTAIDFNLTPLPTTFVDNEHLTAVVPATSVSTAGTLSVTVVNPAPGGGSSNVVYFSVAPPEPTVSFANAPNSPLQIPEAIAIAVGDFNEDGEPD